MDALPRISPEQLKAFLHGHVDEFAEKMVEQVNAAASGRLIADTEKGVRKLIHEFGRSGSTSPPRSGSPMWTAQAGFASG